MSRYVLAPIVFLMLALSGTAHAEDVGRLMKQLKSSSDYKVRLSAALSLSKLREKKAIPLFITALKKDSDKTVRGVSAASLGKIVDSSTSAKIQKLAIDALKTAAASDKDAFVRKQAKKAYDNLKSLGGGGSTAPITGGGTYVNIGTMSAKVQDSEKVLAHMRKTVQKTFKKKASSMMIDWPGGKNPTGKQIKSKKLNAFHVDGTLTELSASPSGSTTVVSCKVSMLLATYPEKSMFGFLKGGASVQSSSSAREVAYAKEDCVAAVMEDLISRKIIPTIKSRSN